MAVNGKQKGASFERKVCQELSLWVSRGKAKDYFWRSAMSGGRATLGHRRGDNLSRQAGDISAVHPDGHVLTDAYYIECKHYRDLDLEAFWAGSGKLSKFWKEAQVGAAKHGRRPLVIAKQNLIPTMVLLSEGCSLDIPQLTAWRSVAKRGGNVSVGWFSSLLKISPVHI